MYGIARVAVVASVNSAAKNICFTTKLKRGSVDSLFCFVFDYLFIENMDVAGR